MPSMNIMSLEERIESEFKKALKDRDAIKVSTLRMLKADITNERFKTDKSDLTEESIIKIIQRQLKQHRDSIEQFRKGQRLDLAEKEEKELAILSGYLPEEIPDEELKKIVAETITELGAAGKKDMGRVMKAVKEKIKGRADGKKVSDIVSLALG